MSLYPISWVEHKRIASAYLNEYWIADRNAEEDLNIIR